MRVEYLHKLFGILLQGRPVSFPPFIYSFNHLHQFMSFTSYICVHLYLFYTLVTVQLCTIYFVAQIVSVLAIWSSFRLVPWTIPHPFVCVCLFFFDTSLLPVLHIIWSHLMYSLPSSRISISLRQSIIKSWS